MQKIDVGTLGDAQASLLIPLWARATEADHPMPVLRDPKAVELVESIDYPFDQFAKAKVSSVSYCIRAVIFDRLVERFLEDHPSGTVVEIGAGLDTRFDRLDNGTVEWFDLDLPDAMALRKRLFDETPRRTFLSTSVLETGWIETVAETAASAVLFVAEGVLYFLARQQVAGLFRRLADRFPGASILFDCQSPLYLLYNNLTHPLRDARLVWSVGRVREIQRWDPRFAMEAYVGFGDPPYYDKRYLRRLPWPQRLARIVYPPARHMFKICQVRLGRSLAAANADEA
jgi:O-methyltransferase involved in polyketide biosynthesis